MSRLKVGEINAGRHDLGGGWFVGSSITALFSGVLAYGCFFPIKPDTVMRSLFSCVSLLRDGFPDGSYHSSPLPEDIYAPGVGTISAILGVIALVIAYVAVTDYFSMRHRYGLLEKRAFTFPCTAHDEVEARNLLDDIKNNYLDCPPDSVEKRVVFHDMPTFEREEDAKSFSQRLSAAYFFRLLTLGKQGLCLISLAPKTLEVAELINFVSGGESLRFLTIGIHQSGLTSEFNLVDSRCSSDRGWYTTTPLAGEDSTLQLLKNLYEEVKTSLYGEALGINKTKIDPIVSPVKPNEHGVVRDTYSPTSGAAIGNKAEQAYAIEGASEVSQISGNNSADYSI